MQISDMLGQYSRNVSNKTEELKSASGMQKVVSSIGELSPGNVFEGTVSSAKGGRVVLSLSDGQSITARLAGKVDLTEGTPMFFQVKSNDGTTVEIKPYTGAGSGGNPILMNALTEGGVPVTAKNLALVDSMMKEQMPIDRQSVANMARVANMNPQVSTETLVQMTKLGIPVTEEMAAQFENYRTDSHMILQDVGQAMEQLAGLAGSGELDSSQAAQLNRDIIGILFPQDGGENTLAQSVAQEAAPDAVPDNAQSVAQNGASAAVSTQNGASAAVSTQNGAAGSAFTSLSADSADVSGLQANGEAVSPDRGQDAAQTAQARTLGDVLSAEQLSNLGKAMQNLPELAGNGTLFPGAGEEDVFVNTLEDDALAQNFMTAENGGAAPELDSGMSVREFLQTVAQTLSKQPQSGSVGIGKLFGSEEYRNLVQDALEEQWLLKPDDLKQENKVNELYGRMERQLKQVEDALQQAGIARTAFSDASAAVRGNIEFMNQINQLYTYVQIPLKLSGQSANGELYVYTNKKNLRDPDGEVSAFLHLDLDNLGTTDVSVKMQKKNVRANFYMADDASYDMVAEHLPELEERLAQKGYRCTVTVSREEKKVDFTEDFLRRDLPQAGTLHRYSFDVKA